jgi:hypothetical protein
MLSWSSIRKKTCLQMDSKSLTTQGQSNTGYVQAQEHN